jgi:YD repeat-containing protein
MAPTACSNTHLRICLRLSLCLLFSLSFAVTAHAQTATYHLHGDANLFQLKTAGPDAASLALQSANLKNQPVGEYLIKAFDTPSGVPNASGTIPAGSTITFTLWLRKTSSSGAMFPRAKLNLNSAAGTLLGTSTSGTALTNTLTKYTFNTTTGANVVMTAADRFYLWVGVNVTAAPTTNTNAELDIEGIVNGNYDSLVVAPLPVSAPTISNLSPGVGPVGTSVTVTGSGFGATQGTSTVKFNSVTGAPTNWSNTSIVCPVPPGATTGPVVVTVGGTASNGSTFTVADTGAITGTVSRASDAAGINGALIEALQSGIVKASATSGANGSYSIAGLMSGTYDVRASAARYSTQVQSGVVVSAPSSTSVNFSLVDVGPITNIYDELGRLVAVIDPGGETVTYRYDSVGNLQSISRSSSSQVSILEFTPDKGPIGASVIIYGTAFSQTPAENVVKFNGTNAAVSASTSTQITTTVPAGATSGLITVTTPSGTATSSTPFTVGSDAPVITSFTPGIGAAGTVVNISGSNFDSTPSANRVAFNGTRSTVTAATSSALTTTVPAGATSGRISDTTPVGNGVSSDYFFIPPPPLTAADVEVFSQMVIGGSKTVTIATANKVAMVLFDGNAGQRVSLKLTAVTISSSYVYIYKPDGSIFGSISVNTSGGFIDTQTLPVDGTYTILVDPSSTNTGSMTLNLYGVADVTGTITAGGAAVTVTTTIPGQNAQLTFAGTAGQRMSINSSSTFGSCWNVGIYKPDGSQLMNTFGCGSSIFIEPQTLPVTGNYVILIDPSGSNTGQATINLYEVIDITGTINFGGPAVSITITTPGQNARLTFVGSAGQRASVNATASFGACWNLGVYKPDGSQLTNTFGCGSSTFLEPQSLPDSGTYTIVVDPSGAGVGGATVTLYEVTDVTGPITINGPSVIVSLPTPGQNARLSFDGTAGQQISANGSSNFTGCWNFGIYKPDGSQLTNTFGCGSNIFIEPQTLPVSGTYTLVVDPSGAATGQATVSLYEVADVTGTIIPNGPAVPVTLATPGQIARLTFDSTAGQRISANGSSNFTGCWNFGIYKPDGSQLANTFGCGSNIFIEPQTLPVSGTFTLVVDPSGAATGQATINAYDVVDLTGSAAIDGPAVSSTITTPGQTARLAFDGTAGQRVSVNSTSNMTGCWTLAMLKPDATQLTSVFGCGSSIFIEPQTLPVSGAYTVLIDPSGAATGQATVNLYGVTDVTGAVTLGGLAVNVSLTAPGQNASLTLSATAGQQATVRVSGSTMSCVRVTLLKPDGSTVTTTFSCSGSFNLSTQTLPVTGTYTITIDPSGANTGSMSVSATNP